MLPSHPGKARAAPEPRIGGPVRDLQEEEELQLAITILKMNQRLDAARKGRFVPMPEF